MTRAIAWGAGALLALVPIVLVILWAGSASGRLDEAEKAASESSRRVVVAQAANEQYCTPELKQILRRVLTSCGLVTDGAARGCQPVEARSVATMDDADFNALFVPMQARGGIVQYDHASSELDAEDAALIDRVFADRRGASYFFVVARASPDGPVEVNRDLSRARAEAVLEHLDSTFHDPDLADQVGLLWLGEEYAQLDASFCEWQRSGVNAECAAEDLNRSAFVAWIDCRL
jgi:outer membrane protein OmpA-like peptidoglycan-associated protein